MSVEILSHVTKNANGTIDIPFGTTMVVALLKGSEAAPIFNGVTMVPVDTLPAVSPVEAVGIFYYKCAFSGMGIPFTFTGSRFTIDFYCFSGAVGIKSSFSGYDVDGYLTGGLEADESDLFLGILACSEGPSELKGDSTAFTYEVNSTLLKVGHLVPPDSSVNLQANDLGTSNGYYVRETYTIPGELISPERREVISTYHPGYWGPEWNGYLGSYENVWHVPYYTYTTKIYPAVYSNPVTVTTNRWVGDGVSGKVNAIICCLTGTGSAQKRVFSPLMS